MFSSSRLEPSNKERWPEDSAGREMTNQVPVVALDDTLANTSSFLSRHIKDLEFISYIYVVNDDKKLAGVFSHRDLYLHPRETKVEKICKRSPLITVSPTSDREEAAYTALQNNIKAIPVVDENKIFLGAVISDALLSILHKELREDILQFAGIHKVHVAVDNILEIPLLQAIKHRFPWLLIGLAGGLLAAQIISQFEQTLEKNLLLAAFIPLVVYIADAVGTQLEAFVIRDFALFRQLNFAVYFFKQFLIVLIVAVLLASILTIASTFLYGNLAMAAVLGAAVIGAVISSLLTGLLIPFFFRKLNLDPANASGPIATIIQDILSVLIYLSVATWLL